MGIVVKFIVANEANAYMVSQLATEYFAEVAPMLDKRAYSVSAFLNSSASFTREWLMSFDLTGEDEDRLEEALVFIEMVSSNMPEEIKGEKPLYIDKIASSSRHEGLSEVIDRAIAIAMQRKHDALWINVPSKDDNMLSFLKNAGFAKAGELPEALLLKKEL